MLVDFDLKSDEIVSNTTGQRKNGQCGVLVHAPIEMMTVPSEQHRTDVCH